METQNVNSSTTRHHTHSKMDICIQNCLDCFKICEQTLAECFGKQGKHSQASHLILLKSCAEICHTSAKFMMMQSKFHTSTCGVCAEVCQACAESCEAIGDEGQKKCAEACRKCAESCSEMSQWDH
jgi:hypothetical protein